jgi:hypothetical protein
MEETKAMTAATSTESTPADAESVGAGGGAECWCCGHDYSAERLVHLGSHPEVGVCLRCAHFLHHQAGQREDALRPSIASRLRDGLRWGRRVVMERGWHQRAVIGRPLRWLGQRLP